MTFDEIVAEVISWASAPHLETSIRSAVRRAILNAHRKEKFWRDLSSVTVGSLPTNTLTHQIDIAAQFPQFRQLSYVKVTGQDIFMEIVDAEDLLDNDGYAKANIVFLAGTYLNLKLKAAQSSIDVWYWKDPIVSPPASLNSWIAAGYPDLIIAAATKIALSFNSESEIYKAAVQAEIECWAEVIRNNIEAEGR